MSVVKAQRFGREVYLSEIAEEGRKSGCLCVHEKNGKKVYCRRLLNNIEMQNWYAEHLSERTGERFLPLIAEKALSTMMLSGSVPFNDLKDTDPCPIALVLFEVCKAGGVACGVSFCPGYLAPEEKSDR